MEVTKFTVIEQEAAELEAINLRLSWVERRRYEQELEGFGLTLPQYMSLRCIRTYSDGCSMTALAESSHQLTATMTGIIDRLVDRGLVVRARDERDRRAMRVALTPAGEALMDRVSQHKRAALVDALALLPVEERRAMIDVSRRYLLFVEGVLRASTDQQAAKESASKG